MDATLKKVAKAARDEARRLRRLRRYPYGSSRCVEKGEPVCVFGAVLARAGLLDHQSFQAGTFVTNTSAFATAFNLKLDAIPEHIDAALRSLSLTGDNEAGWDDAAHRNKTAEALAYLADVLTFAELPTGFAIRGVCGSTT
jgi:hypothetical protein